MPRFLLRVLLALAALALVGGACSSSDDDSADDEDSTEIDDSSDSSDDEEASDDDGRANALDLVERAGFSGEGAECVVDSIESAGVDLADLDLSDVANPSGDLAEAFANAGVDCPDAIDDLPEGATDLNDPAVYDGFVQGFSQTTGLSTEVSECVADYFLANDIDPTSLDASNGQEVVTDALAECQ